MSHDQLSVMVTAHNEEKYLVACIESIMAAVGSRSEVIIFDDGSSDSTKNVAEALAEKYRNIVLDTHPGGVNKGEWASRNQCISRAKGEYLSFLDADDLMIPERFENAISILDAEQSIDGVLDPVAVFFDAPSAEMAWGNTNRVFTHATDIAPDDFLGATFDGRVQMLTPGLVVRKSLYAKSGVYQTHRRLSEDYHLWLRMAACGRFRVAEATRPKLFYRRHSANTWIPHAHDSFRDLRVVGEVLDWARSSPWVGEANVRILERTFQNKLFHCFQLAQDARDRTAGLTSALVAARYAPRIIFQRGFWANVGRLSVG